MVAEVDVAVVGGRIAGCVVAAMFADAGLSVVLVERAPLPSPTLSTHFFRGDGLGAVLQRLSVIDAVLALDCPPLTRQWTAVGNSAPEEAPPQSPGTLGYALSVRREALDAVLAARARRAGAELIDRCRVVDVVSVDGRVEGIVVAHASGPSEIRSRLVVGADGRRSLVARAVRAPVEEREAGHRGLFYCYVEGWAPVPGCDQIDAAEFSLGDDEMAYVFPSDAGLTCVALTVSSVVSAWLREDLQRRFFTLVAGHKLIAPRLGRATVVSRVLGTGPEDNVVRSAAGPGWVLVGDAGQHQDPWTGVGMDLAATHGAAMVGAYLPWLVGAASEEEAAETYRDTRDGPGRETWRATVVGSRRIGA